MTILPVLLPLCRLLYRPPRRWKVRVALAAALDPETPTILNPPLPRKEANLKRQLLLTPPFVKRTAGPPPLPMSYVKEPLRFLTMVCVLRQSLLTFVIIMILYPLCNAPVIVRTLLRNLGATEDGKRNYFKKLPFLYALPLRVLRVVPIPGLQVPIVFLVRNDVVPATPKSTSPTPFPKHSNERANALFPLE